MFTTIITSTTVTGIFTFFINRYIDNKFEKDIIGHNEKLQLYETAIAPFTRYLGKISRSVTDVQNWTVNYDDFATIDDLRLELHGLLGLFAPKVVMDAYDHHCDCLMDYSKGVFNNDFSNEEQQYLAWKNYTDAALEWVCLNDSCTPDSRRSHNPRRTSENDPQETLKFNQNRYNLSIEHGSIRSLANNEP